MVSSATMFRLQHLQPRSILLKACYRPVLPINQRRLLATAIEHTTSTGRINQSYLPSPVQYASNERYWTKIPAWQDVTVDQFLSHKWQMSNTVQSPSALKKLLLSVLPARIPAHKPPYGEDEYPEIHTREDFIRHVELGIQKASMAVRISPHTLSVIDWADPLNDSVRRQFIPVLSKANVDHPACAYDPTEEQALTPVPGLIHRYGTKALFLSTSVCPVYCRFCFRSYTVGGETEMAKKKKFLPILKQWMPRFEYIQNTPQINDVTFSGGDTYVLEPNQIAYLGDRMLQMPHIKRFRFATKGLCVSPSRLLDPNDEWIDTIIRIEREARKQGKHVCIHTHFNTDQEITWITRLGAQKLHEAGVKVRSQGVLLNGVNNTREKLINLVNGLADINIEPYYIYLGDMVPGAEDLRTPLSHALDLEAELKDQIGGFLVPRFVCEIPEAGKRYTMSAFDYDHRLGCAKFTAPRMKGKSWTHWDPL